jgi:iron complex outermembrane receptor protein
MPLPIRRTLATGALLAASIPAAAAVNEIIVTAQRREQSLQDVPLAVSAFDATSIVTRQIDAVADIGQNVPNLQTYIVTAGAQALQLHSRGASVQNPGFNLSESPVGIYIDDVYYGRLASANLDLTDLERIEVLRGPQGTLYGRNTIAGAVKIVTRTPGDEKWANANLAIGNYSTSRIAGSVGGPIEEGALAGSITGLYEQRNEGWQPNPRLGRDFGEYDNKLARAKIRWYGTENFEATLTGWVADLTNDGYNGVPYAPISNADPSDPASPPSLNPGFDPAPGNSAPIGGFYDNFSAAGANYGASDQGGASLALNFTFGSVTLKSITAFADIKDEFGFDFSGGAFDFTSFVPPFSVTFDPGVDPEDPANQRGLRIRSDSDFTQISQEFQLLGNAFDDRLAWQVGAFYLNEDGTQVFSGTIPAALFPGDPVTATPDFSETIENETDSYALYAHGSYNVTDALSVTAGLRWTRDEKEYSNACTGGFCFDDSDLLPPPDEPTPGTGSVTLDDDWDEVTAKLGVDYRLDPENLLYASYAQGFQSGGFRTLCFGNLSSTCGGTAFDPQTVDSFEAGWKSDLFDRRLRLNVAAFYAMYDDIQQVVLSPGANANGFPITNIGEVDVYGLEVEVNWQPTDKLLVFAQMGFQESDFGQVDPQSPPGGLEPPVGVAPDDVCPNRPNPGSSQCALPVQELPSNPGFQGKLGFSYTVPLQNNLQFTYGADIYYTDEYFSEARNLVQIDSFSRVNAFVGVGSDDGRWQIGLTGRNVLDSEDNVSGIFANGSGNIRTVLPPAEYLLQVRLQY